MAETKEKDKTDETKLPGDPDGDGDDGGQVEDLFIVGTKGQISMSIGGKKSAETKLKLPGGQIDVEGGFEKGDVIDVEMRLRVWADEAQDKVDPATGDITGGPRIFKAKLVERPKMLGKASDRDD